MTDRLIADVLRAADGDELAFARVCREPRVALLIENISARFYAPGRERQDFAQDARIALLESVRDWNAERDVDGFLGFAGMVVKRRLQDALTKALRGKHGVLSRAADLDSPVPGSPVEAGGPLRDVLPGGVDPLAAVIAREELAAVVHAVGQMSELERCAVEMLLSSEPYTWTKRMDNAVQRARRKLRAAVA